MALYTVNYLKQIARTETSNESTKLFSQRTQKHISFDIFLCHSYLDKEEIKGMYLELTRQGYSVYVDWIVDPNLDRSRVTKETAELIRQRLHSSASLLLVFSINAGMSKWMPWELGYVDGNKHNCAIVPVADDASPSYKRSEYLLLYPELLRPGNTMRENDPLYVMENENTYVDLASWSRGSKPVYRSHSLY